MKKLFLLVLGLLVSVWSFTVAYELKNQDWDIVEKLAERVESMILERWENYRWQFMIKIKVPTHFHEIYDIKLMMSTKLT